MGVSDCHYTPRAGNTSKRETGPPDRTLGLKPPCVLLVLLDPTSSVKHGDSNTESLTPCSKVLEHHRPLTADPSFQQNLPTRTFVFHTEKSSCGSQPHTGYHYLAVSNLKQQMAALKSKCSPGQVFLWAHPLIFTGFRGATWHRGILERWPHFCGSGLESWAWITLAALQAPVVHRLRQAGRQAGKQASTRSLALSLSL